MPALSERENLDFEQLVARVLLLHLTDDEIEQYLIEGVGEFGQARVDAHLERCLICARRVQTTREILALGPGDCDLFRPLLVEFSQISKKDRDRQMAELQAHLEGCPECRQDYWEVTPLWRQTLEQGRQTLEQGRQTGNFIHKMLSEGLGLALTQAGRLLQTGLGPFANLDRVVYASLSSSAEEGVPITPADDGATRKEWVLTDDEARCSIRLTASGWSAAQAALCCEFESEPLADIDPASVRIEVKRAEDEDPLVSGPLSYFRGEPIVLAPGSWLIKLQVSDGPRTFVWEVPLTLSAVS